MAAGAMHKRKKQRRIAILTTLALGLSLLGLSFQIPASAVIGAPPDQSSFNAENGVVDTSGSGRTVLKFTDKASGSTDDSYSGGGPKEDDACPSVDLSHAAPPKADLTNSWFGTDTARPGVLYLAWERKSATGTITVDFELNQSTARCLNGVNPARTFDDLLITYDFQGGTSIGIQARRWTGSVWGAPTTLSAADTDASIRPDESFGELAIDLFASRILNPDPTAACVALASGFAKTRTGGAFATSTIKDFIVPQSDLTISNCGSLTIVKDAQPNAADDFAFTTTGSDLSNFTLDDDADGTLSNTKAFSAHPGTKTVAETLSGGWTLGNISCSGPGASKVKVGSDGDADFAAGDTQLEVALAVGDDITCTFVNSLPGSITITKNARPDNGRDFAFTSTGGPGTFTLDDDGTLPSPSATPASTTFTNVAAPGAYTFTEGAATGWTLGDIDCGAKAVTENLQTRTVGFSLANGESVACTFVNDKTPPEIVVTKDPTPTSVDEPGGNVTYTVKVVNNSPLDVTLSELSDNRFGDLGDPANPLLSASTCNTAVGKVLQEANATASDEYSCSFTAFVAGNPGAVPSTGTHTNIVTASGSDEDGVAVSDTDDAVVTIKDVLPKIGVTKAASKTLIHSGDPLTYTYNVTNPGIEPLAVAMSDNKCSTVTYQSGDSAAVGTVGKLDPSETWVYTCVQSPALTATTTNIITATGTDDEGNPVKATAEATVTVLKPAINVVKSASPGTIHSGDKVVYTYVVTNTGDATPLHAVTIKDDKCASITGPTGDTGVAGVLIAGETWTYTCEQPLTDTTTNIVKVTGTDDLDLVVEHTATKTVTVLKPAIEVVKTVDKATIHSGDTVVYGYSVTTKGSATPLTAVTIADDKCKTITGPTGDGGVVNTLELGETWVYSCAMALTNTTTNVVNVTGTDQLGRVVDHTATKTATVLKPTIDVVKTSDKATLHSGDTVTYTYAVTNSGSATPLTGVTIADDKCATVTGPTGDTAPIGTLSAGETWIYSCAMALTNSTTNVVTVTAKDDLGLVVTDTDTKTVTVLKPAINVVKAADKTVVHAGDTVTYTYTVTNPGDTALSNITIADDKCASVTGPTAGGDVDGDNKLDVGETWVFTCKQALAGTTTNTVVVGGTDDLGRKVTGNAAATVVVIKPAIAIDKTPSATSVEPGTTVVYTYTVTNPGDVPLSAVTVSDDKCSPVTFVRGDVNVDKLLQVGETWVFQCSQVQTGSLDTLTNVGTATGVDTLGLKVVGSDTVSISVVAPAVITRPAPPVETAPAVITAPATLPRTGSDAKGLLQLAGSLILLGLALMLTARPISRLRRS